MMLKKITALVLFALLLLTAVTAAADTAFDPGTFADSQSFMAITASVTDFATTDTSLTVRFDKPIPGGSYQVYYYNANNDMVTSAANASGNTLTFTLPSGWKQDARLTISTYFSACEWHFTTARGDLYINNGVLVEFTRYKGDNFFQPCRVAAVPDDRTDYVWFEFKDGAFYSYIIDLYQGTVKVASVIMNADDTVWGVRTFDASGTETDFMTANLGYDLSSWAWVGTTYGLNFR